MDSTVVETKTTAEAVPEVLAVSQETARAMLGSISRTAWWRLEHVHGLIAPIPDMSPKRYRVEDVRKLVNGKGRKK